MKKTKRHVLPFEEFKEYLKIRALSFVFKKNSMLWFYQHLDGKVTIDITIHSKFYDVISTLEDNTRYSIEDAYERYKKLSSLA